MLHIVGIIGKHGSGKTTLAGNLERLLIQRLCGEGKDKIQKVVREALSFPIKAIGSQMVGAFPIDKCETYKVGPKPETGRSILEWVGTEFEARFPGIWSQLLLARLEEYDTQRENILVLVDDVRLASQAACCDFLILLGSDHNPFSSPSLPSEKDIHPTWEKFDGPKVACYRTLQDSLTLSPQEIVERIAKDWEERVFGYQTIVRKGSGKGSRRRKRESPSASESTTST